MGVGGAASLTLALTGLGNILIAVNQELPSFSSLNKISVWSPLQINVFEALCCLLCFGNKEFYFLATTVGKLIVFPP